jgi:hypothetical protein
LISGLIEAEQARDTFLEFDFHLELALVVHPFTPVQKDRAILNTPVYIRVRREHSINGLPWHVHDDA